MARKHEAVEWLKKGYPPSSIAKQMNVTVSTVVGYLYNQVGEGRIRRSDIVFSIDQKTRDAIEHFVSETGSTYWYHIYQSIERSGGRVDRDDLRIYLTLRDARVALGDMYEIIRDIEMALHSIVRQILIRRYGADDWWAKAVPEKIRSKCEDWHKKDQEPASDPYCYTNFLHLREILEKEWRTFVEILPKKLASEKKKLLSGLARLNRVRNAVMHPVRGTAPTERDFGFVRGFRDFLELERWLSQA